MSETEPRKACNDGLCLLKSCPRCNPKQYPDMTRLFAAKEERRRKLFQRDESQPSQREGKSACPAVNVDGEICKKCFQAVAAITPT